MQGIYPLDSDPRTLGLSPLSEPSEPATNDSEREADPQAGLRLEGLAPWLSTGAESLLIAGPCSAESPEQVLAAARGISQHAPAVRLLRAGVWKPRTRPGSFNGAGIQALPWLQAARDETGLGLAIEVALPTHVEAALKAEIDVLWLGARTTANPFAVQDLADALEGCDVPVLVKNPVNPDLELWVGALERLALAGIHRLGAVLRGFTPHAPTAYRNAPGWRFAVELRRRLPDLPILCDPSHIAGDRALVPTVSQMALDLGMDGLMIEVHPDPGSALSDASQQLRPSGFGTLLDGLVVKSERPQGAPEFDSRLAELRRRIDAFDAELLSVLAKRQEISQAIGDMKRELAVTPLQIRRWDSLLMDRLDRARSLGLPEDLIRDIFDAIHEASLRRQTSGTA